jgi:hypothetical protein
MKTRAPYRQILATTLAASGLFSLALPVLAEGTVAGTNISNTATATYEDPNAPGTTINATSNTVTVTVAEVAGVTVTASGATDVNGGSVQVGDTLQYVYTITNVGNDPTRFRIPNLATVTGPGSVSGNLEVSPDGGTTWNPILATELITTAIAPGGSVLVRVPVTVNAGAQANDIINVTLGDTPGNAQNQLRNPNGGDVYTVDNPDDGPGGLDVDGVPVNGVREASMTQQVTVTSTLKTYALATLLKTRSAYNNASTPAIADDTLTYDLSMRVEGTDPTGNGITPAPLVGSTITLNGAAATRILISDAIPAGTNLAAAPAAPPGWQAVYSTTPITPATNANVAAWTTIAPTDLSTVTRVGFVNNPAVVTSVSPGITVTGFSVQLAIESAAASPLTVANIAQLFGQTPGTNAPVYDESGDQDPSNYTGNVPPVGSDINADGVPDIAPTVNDGYINDPTDLTNTGTDPSNNNTGTGTDGEANVFIVATPLAAALQNGPENVPDAIGPTSVNDDFTNKSSLVPPNTAPGSTLDPAPVAFTNTVRNSGTNIGELTLAPKPPATLTDLPDGTTVTITYGADSVSYTYNAGTYAITSSTTGGNPITIANVVANQVVNYGVEVNLPPGTPLSTDVNRGFPVPIEAAINTDGNPGAEATNETIDRVYTGFLKMVKESRILPGTGPAPAAADTTFSADPKNPAPGNIIEYRITYTNISEPQAGTGNVLLNASNVRITEDGVTGSNNWALDNDADGRIDTSNIVGSARDSGTSTITFFSGNPATTAGTDQTGTTVASDVTRYVNTVTGIVAPGVPRNFTFQRRVN